MVLLSTFGERAAAIEVRQWQETPYRVRASIAVDDSARPQPNMEASIARHVAERVDSVIAPLWKFELHPAADAAARRFCHDPVETPRDKVPGDLKDADKHYWLSVVATPTGYDLQCRELDLYLNRWGTIHRRQVAQSSFLAEACFEILRDSFSPLAIVETIAENDKQVRLAFKGSNLPRAAEGEAFVAPNRAYLPLLRRTDRRGALAENGVQPVPWTLLATTAQDDAGWLADVRSGVRRPFGMRRSAMIGLLAIGLNNPPGPAKVRFHSRRDAKLGLAGYDVYRSLDDGDTQLLGVTDSNGVFATTIDDAPVATLLLRSESQLMAKLPLAAGAGEMVEIPIADNPVRLKAQSESRVVREELIDVVARRAILTSRVRAMLKAGRLEDAQKIMSELDSLPSRSSFNRDVDVLAQRTPKTDDPMVQQAINKLFAATRDLLGKFLDPRQITELQNEVNTAKPVAEPTDSTASS